MDHFRKWNSGTITMGADVHVARVATARPANRVRVSLGNSRPHPRRRLADVAFSRSISFRGEGRSADQDSRCGTSFAAKDRDHHALGLAPHCGPRSICRNLQASLPGMGKKQAKGRGAVPVRLAGYRIAGTCSACTRRARRLIPNKSSARRQRSDRRPDLHPYRPALPRGVSSQVEPNPHEFGGCERRKCDVDPSRRPIPLMGDGVPPKTPLVSLQQEL